MYLGLIHINGTIKTEDKRQWTMCKDQRLFAQ